MITVPNRISPTVTNILNQKSRARMLGSVSAKNVKELRAKQSAGENNANDREARIAMVLAGEDFPPASDIEAQLTTEMLRWQAADEADRSLDAPLAKARYEDATVVLKGLKPGHDAALIPALSALAEVFAPAWKEIFQLSRDLKDKDLGWREGVCDLVPQLVELFGVPNAHSPLASFLQKAVAAGYLKSAQLPKEFR
jgi:hypothetical protein